MTNCVQQNQDEARFIKRIAQWFVESHPFFREGDHIGPRYSWFHGLTYDACWAFDAPVLNEHGAHVFSVYGFIVLTPNNNWTLEVFVRGEAKIVFREHNDSEFFKMGKR